MIKRNLLTCVILLSFATNVFATEMARPKPTPKPTPQPTPSIPATLGFHSRSIHCANAAADFQVFLAPAQMNGQISEGQPNFNQRADWKFTAKDDATKKTLGTFAIPGASTTPFADAMSFSGYQTGYYSPSLKRLVGNWVWVPNATDVYKNEGIVPPQSKSFNLVLTDGTITPLYNSAVLWTNHTGNQMSLSITSGNEGGAANAVFNFAATECQGQDGI